MISACGSRMLAQTHAAVFDNCLRYHDRAPQPGRPDRRQ
ncbi:MAG: hypothetical protein AB7K35_08045, partial [Pseudorhodoplanes sp.]